MAIENRAELDRSLQLITLAGCLFMVFNTCITSPVTAEYFRQIGLTEFHFGILGGLPFAMLGMQFAGALLCNRLRARKRLFMFAAIGGRALYLPVAFVPLFLSRGEDGGVPSGLFVSIMFFMAAFHALNNLIGPLFFSWVGDLVPKRVLNRYWGKRHQYMTLTWAVSYVSVAAFTYFGEAMPATLSFRWLATVGVAAGILDIVLFIWIREPPNTTSERAALEVLLQPLRDRRYRSLIRYSSAWLFSALFAAAFMQLYVLKILGLPLWQVNLIWCSAGLGGAFVSTWWGALADRHGSRPVLIVVQACKPMIVICFLLIDARTALFVLPVAFFFDSMFNAGFTVANSGYMLKMAPNENRSMFVAAITAISGLAGGLGAFLGGTLLKQTEGWSMDFAGRTWINYHLLFATSLCLRLTCFAISFTIREPASSRPVTLLNDMRGAWPLRVLDFPIGLYRRLAPWGKWEEEELPTGSDQSEDR